MHFLQASGGTAAFQIYVGANGNLLTFSKALSFCTNLTRGGLTWTMFRVMHDDARTALEANMCVDTWFMEPGTDGWKWGDGVLQSDNNGGYDSSSATDAIPGMNPSNSDRCLVLTNDNKEWLVQSCEAKTNGVICMVASAPTHNAARIIVKARVLPSLARHSTKQRLSQIQFQRLPVPYCLKPWNVDRCAHPPYRHRLQSPLE